MNTILNKETTFLDLGMRDYQDAWNFQVSVFEKILNVKSDNRNLPIDQHKPTENYLLFVEHPHVFTLGKSGNVENLLLKHDELHTIGATFYHINRGGDITYHGPGQLVGYPILDLENFFTDIHQYMRFLEEAVILTLKDYGVESGRIPGLTGVWIDGQDEKNARKICALGVKTSRWVTMHGFAFNINTDLDYFRYIVPCGIEDKAVTSLEKELGFSQNFQEVAQRLKMNLAKLFEMVLMESKT